MIIYIWTSELTLAGEIAVSMRITSSLRFLYIFYQFGLLCACYTSVAQSKEYALPLIESGRKKITQFVLNFSSRGWSPKFETGINIIIKSALYSILWQDSITNIKINSFQIFWRLCDPFYWEYTKDLLGVYFGYTGGIFGLYLSYGGAKLELYRGYLILGV